MTTTALGTGGVNSVTWAAATTATRAGVDPAEGGILVAIGYALNDEGSPAGGSFSNSGWTGTAPTWSTAVVIGDGSSGIRVRLAMSYSTNAYTGNGSVVATFTSSAVTGCAVVEITGASYTFADDASAAAASTINLDPQGDVNIAAFLVASTTDHVWSNAAEVFDSTENAAGGAARGSAASDETSPVDPSATPTTGNRAMVGLSFTTGTVTLTQAATRFYADGDPASSTALGDQNADITGRLISTPTQFRARIQASGDPAAIAPRVEWRVAGDAASTWEAVS